MPEETHASDRALEVKIEALTKLNDVRFGYQDKALENLDKKMDSILNAGYITKVEYDKRHGEIETRILSLEIDKEKRLKALEDAKNIADGKLQAVQWIWGIGLAIVGILEPVGFHYWK